MGGGGWVGGVGGGRGGEGREGEGEEITHTDNCLSLGEPSMFVCGWPSKFTSTIGQG